MQIETLRDVLSWTEIFHKRLSESLSQSAEASTDERAKMVLNYLSGHEQDLTKVIKDFELNGNENALNTWCAEYIQERPISRRLHRDVSFENLNTEQVMEVIVDQHKQVVTLYQYLASRADIPSAQEILSALSSMEEHEIKRMVHAANRFSDM